ncbi:hypothetical protein JCM10908_001586 [Rhodotorula pacifica]|uniref:Golgi pH regulator family protein n=1 Tax=Rhodotorula pacifica TaxID=1495444 RepID=UPI003170622B
MDGAVSDPLQSGSARSVLFESGLLTCVRLVYFLACRRYVDAFLLAGLKDVIREDGIASDEEGQDGESIRLDDAENGVFTGGGGAAAGNGKPREDGLNSPLLPTSIRRTSAGDVARRNSQSPLYGRTSASRTYSQLASALFCLAFSESSMLFTLLLFGDAISQDARNQNWSFSLLTLLALIVFLIPFGLCLLLTQRSRSGLVRTLAFTLVPFGTYLFFFYEVGSIVADKLVTEGSHSFGVVNSLLSRLCVPGVVLIATLSGAGAVNTAWEAYEWRSVSSAEAVSDAHISQAERAHARARLDLQQRTRALELAKGSAAREADAVASRSLLSRWTSSAPAATQLKNLELEIGALEKMERQMADDVSRLRKRKSARELGRSWKGRAWLMVGWLFSIYCVWRVFISCVNLIFGYSRRSHQRLDGAEPGSTNTQGTDLLTSLLTRLAVLLNIELDIATWSRMIGLALIGGILLANMRNVLGSVSRIFKATSMGVSASFMLLFLAQLMAIYLLTSLISLPSSPSEASTSLLDTLPDFNVFSRLFDSVFLLAAVAIFVSRWIGRQFRDDAGLAAMYA